jgi:hypothetical protein
MVLGEELLFKVAEDVSIRVVDETLQHRSDVTLGKIAVLINSGSEPIEATNTNTNTNTKYFRTRDILKSRI